MDKKIINNCGSEHINYKYIIFREVDGENWFYGADNNLYRCSKICAELGSNARVIETDNAICKKF